MQQTGVKVLIATTAPERSPSHHVMFEDSLDHGSEHFYHDH